MPQSEAPVESLAELNIESETELVNIWSNIYFIQTNKLTANSQFFARALEVPMVEKRERKVMIKEIEGSIFEKVVKFITEGSFLFNVDTEACEALEASDRLDMKELKEKVCDAIKNKLDPDNAKAVASLAERFSAKQLFKAAFDFMQKNEIKLEKEDVVENPSLVLAFIEGY